MYNQDASRAAKWHEVSVGVRVTWSVLHRGPSLSRYSPNPPLRPITRLSTTPSIHPRLRSYKQYNDSLLDSFLFLFLHKI